MNAPPLQGVGPCVARHPQASESWLSPVRLGTFVARIQTGLFTTGANLQRRIYDRGEMDISIVIPVYNEREALPALYHAMVEALDRLPQSAEIIFLDDGSNGGSADIFDGFAETDERVQVLHYSETMARRPR